MSKKINDLCCEEILKVDDHLEVIKDNLTDVKQNKKEYEYLETEKDIDINSILSKTEIQETHRCYGTIGVNEIRDGKCKICGKETSFKGRYLCYEHYKQYLM